MNAHENIRPVRNLALGLLALALAAAGILWSWNALASDLFGLTRMELRHAVAAEVLLITAGALFAFGTGRRKHRE